MTFVAARAAAMAMVRQVKAWRMASAWEAPKA